MSSIFLSYNKADKRFVQKFADRLTKTGVFVWLDERELNIGDPFIDRISKAIDRADYVGAILSRNSVQSSWVKKELELAMTKEIKGKKVVILPVLIEDCEILSYLSDKLYADFRKKHRFEDEFVKLLRTLKVSKRSNQLLRRLGVSVDWTKEGPRIYGNEVIISPLEWTALFNRYL